MTDAEFTGIGRAFGVYLRAFRPYAGFAGPAGA